MYRVLLIDDEPWALEGIRRTFQWERSGFEVIAATTKASEALDVIFKQAPDVVFTDIRMPKISGIEMIQKVRELEMNTEFVIVSGFSDFSYAQEAIRQGAFDYCLKPLKSDYAHNLLKRLFQHLEKKNSSKDLELFEDIVENYVKLEQIIRKRGWTNSCLYYQAAIVVTDNIETSNELLKRTSAMDSLRLSIGTNKYFYLFNTDSDIADRLNLSNLFSLKAGISSVTDSLKDIAKIYTEADMAVRNSFIYETQNIYHYEPINAVVLNEVSDKICQLISHKCHSKIKNQLKLLPELARANDFLLEDILYLWNQMTAFLNKNFPEESFDYGFEFMDYNQLTGQFKNIECLCEFWENGILTLIENEDSFNASSEKGNKDFSNLLLYIQDHYTEQLYLRDIAKLYYIHPNYCCNLFKKYTGTTFSNYINKIRIENSKKLLENTDLSVEDISCKVGYSDYYYFNKLFKKYEGITPFKFRKSLSKQ